MAPMHPKKLHSLISSNNQELFDAFLDFPKVFMIYSGIFGYCFSEGILRNFARDGKNWKVKKKKDKDHSYSYSYNFPKNVQFKNENALIKKFIREKCNFRGWGCYMIFLENICPCIYLKWRKLPLMLPTYLFLLINMTYKSTQVYGRESFPLPILTILFCFV